MPAISFFFKAPATAGIYTLSLHDALPIFPIALLPPSIPGLGAAGGFSFWLQDRSGGTVEFLDQNLQAFLEACRKRPEIAAVQSGFSATVPQIYADVDRDKVLKQGVAIGDV